MRETDAPIAFGAWVREIARNACIDHFRRARRRPELSYDARDGLGPVRSRPPGRRAARPRTPPWPRRRPLGDLQGAFDELSDAHHRILVLRELDGLQLPRDRRAARARPCCGRVDAVPRAAPAGRGVRGARDGRASACGCAASSPRRRRARSGCGTSGASPATSRAARAAAGRRGSPASRRRRGPPGAGSARCCRCPRSCDAWCPGARTAARARRRWPVSSARGWIRRSATWAKAAAAAAAMALTGVGAGEVVRHAGGADSAVAAPNAGVRAGAPRPAGAAGRARAGRSGGVRSAGLGGRTAVGSRGRALGRERWARRVRRARRGAAIAGTGGDDVAGRRADPPGRWRSHGVPDVDRRGAGGVDLGSPVRDTAVRAQPAPRTGRAGRGRSAARGRGVQPVLGVVQPVVDAVRGRWRRWWMRWPGR